MGMVFVWCLCQPLKCLEDKGANGNGQGFVDLNFKQREEPLQAHMVENNFLSSFFVVAPCFYLFFIFCFYLFEFNQNPSSHHVKPIA